MNSIFKHAVAATVMVAAAFGGTAADKEPMVSDESTIANAACGRIQGEREGAVYAFKGIPYARATRFMPPQSVAPVDGILKCRTYGPKAPQGQSLAYRGNGQSDYDYAFQFNLEPMDETNCLVLNVWTNGLDDGRKRPVLVWFHGGGFATGSGHDLPCYEGRALAEKGDIVVVTVNHRLNVLGYFDMSGLGGRYVDSANLGMQDLVKSLEWVRDNIEAFGGDRDCVTIAGQSGGGGKVSAVMMMPAAKGLFHRAIVQSGSFARFEANENSALYARALLNELGIEADDTAALAAVPYDRLVEAVGKSSRAVNMALQSKGQRPRGGMAGPVLDGKHLVAPGFDKSAPEVSRHVPMIIGWNFNEFDFTGGREDKMFRDGAINQARMKAAQGGADVYLYMFDWRPEGNTLGACHGMELPFMFDNIALQPEMTGATKEAYDLADIMSSAWIAFVKTGNPNTRGLPRWEPYNDTTCPTMIFGDKVHLKKK